MKCHACGKELKPNIRDYEYVESGLKNVILKSIRVYECKECNEIIPEIPNVKQIHKWIADYLLKKPGVLTGEELRFLRKAMSKSAKDLAEMLNVDPVTVSRWENNRERIGVHSDRLIRMAFTLDPVVQKAESARAMLEHARAMLKQFIAVAKKTPKPERIVIEPKSHGQDKHPD
jgi:putative zinc finger/helix-turn-helix YgiT family protein